jgi:hypothetical protein
MTTQRNKVHAVTTLPLVARQLGIGEDWLGDIAIGMEPEDGLIWVYDSDHQDGIMAFSDDGIDSFHDLIREHKIQGNFPPKPAA